MSAGKRKGLKSPDIKLFVSDVDGVLTDGGFYVDQEGRQSRRFSVHDGLAFQLVHCLGIPTALVSGKHSPEVLSRAGDLGIRDCLLGVTDKLAAVKNLAAEHSVSLTEICYMGDDLNDLAVLQKVGYAVTVPDAPDELQRICDYVCRRPGGSGAFREAVERVLKAMGLYKAAVEKLTGQSGV